MLGTIQGARDEGRDEGYYLQDDVERGLRTSLISVLTAVLADGEANAEYLKGVFDLARSQAALYGISWCDLLTQLHDVPQMWNLVLALQECSRGI